MEKIAYHFLDIVKKTQMDFNRDEDFINGLTVILSELCTITLILILGLFFDRVTEMLIFLVVFSLIRVDEDCIHMSTPLRCVFATTICACGSLVMSIYINSIMIQALLLVSCTCYYWSGKHFRVGFDNVLQSSSHFFLKFIFITVIAITLLSYKVHFGFIILDTLDIAILTTIKWR